MEIGPILRAMLRNKPGYILIALQIALTMTIMVNAVAIIQERSALMARPSGVDEQNIFYLSSLAFRPDEDLRTLIDGDLRLLRGIPGVVDVVGTNSVPLRGGGWSMGLQTEPGTDVEGSGVAIYFTDEHGVEAFGVDLVAGRNFREEEIVWHDPDVSTWPPFGIITVAMAETLYPDEPAEDAVGKTVYINADNPVQIVGVMERMQAPWSGWDGVERSMLVPQKREFANNRYVIRTENGQLDALMPQIEEELATSYRDRIVKDVRTMTETRRLSYLGDSAMVRMLSFTGVLLAVITGLGIVGLASFSVSRRTKQIGTRRALGATRGAILRYFLVENLLVSLAGLGLGAIGAVGLNVWLTRSFEMPPMAWYLVPMAMLILFVISQLAAAGPARRATRISPALATRTV
ncbi:MAG: FtsX-like permease family protein [Pseudomonadota bacterium]